MDPISDLLTRIRNSNVRQHDRVQTGGKIGRNGCVERLELGGIDADMLAHEPGIEAAAGA